MEMNVLGDKKIVEIWLTKSEKNDPQLRAELKDIFAEWKKKKFTVGVYESGDKELYQSTFDLLSYNKKRLAELEVRKTKEQNAEKPSVLEKLQSFKAQTPPTRPGRHMELEQ